MIIVKWSCWLLTTLKTKPRKNKIYAEIVLRKFFYWQLGDYGIFFVELVILLVTFQVFLSNPWIWDTYWRWEPPNDVSKYFSFLPWHPPYIAKERDCFSGNPSQSHTKEIQKPEVWSYGCFIVWSKVSTFLVESVIFI